MPVDEAAMAKALDGNFYWESTTKYDISLSKMSADIRAAQRKHAPKPRKYEAPEGWWDDAPPLEFVERVASLKEKIAVAFGIPVLDLDSRSTQRSSATPKAFYMWALCRYFPNINYTQMGSFINRHRTTVLHGCRVFELEARLHADMVEKMDKFMGHKPG